MRLMGDFEIGSSHMYAVQMHLSHEMKPHFEFAGKDLHYALNKLAVKAWVTAASA